MLALQPRSSHVLLDGYPSSIQVWGAAAAANLAGIEILAGHPASEAFDFSDVTISWQPAEQQLYLFHWGGINRSLDMSTGTFISSVNPDEWGAPEWSTRWTSPEAQLFLAGFLASEFHLSAFVPQAQIDASGGQMKVEVFIDRDPESRTLAGAIEITHAGDNRMVFPRDPKAFDGRDGLPYSVRLRITPPFRPDPSGRALGLAVKSIGFDEAFR
jgi:hypothetical protein